MIADSGCAIRLFDEALPVFLAPLSKLFAEMCMFSRILAKSMPKRNGTLGVHKMCVRHGTTAGKSITKLLERNERNKVREKNMPTFKFVAWMKKKRVKRD